MAYIVETSITKNMQDGRISYKKLIDEIQEKIFDSETRNLIADLRHNNEILWNRLFHIKDDMQRKVIKMVIIWKSKESYENFARSRLFWKNKGIANGFTIETQQKEIKDLNLENIIYSIKNG